MAQVGRVNVSLNNAEAYDPGVLNDASQGYSVGSQWYNTSAGSLYNCVDNTVGAAQWLPAAAGEPFGKLIGANMNVTTDQAFVFPFSASRKFSLDQIVVANPSLSLTTAVGGIYTAITKGGTPIIAATQVYSALTGATTKVILTNAAAAATLVLTSPIYLSLTTAQGAAATADFYLFGKFIG